MKIVITTDDRDINMAIMKQLDSLQLMSKKGNPDAPELFTVEVDFAATKHPIEHKERAKPGARVQYRALLPDADPIIVAETIKQNLAGFGEHTITGLIYMDLVKAKQEDRWLTEPEIRKARSLPGGTSQRSIGDLKRAGIVEASDVTTT